MEKITSIHWKRLEFKELNHFREDHCQKHHGQLFIVIAEYLFYILPKNRIAVGDRVQFQTKSARSNDIGGEIPDDIFHFEPTGFIHRFFINTLHQLFAAIFYLFVHTFEFTRRESRAQLLSHDPPPQALRKEQTSGQKIDRLVEIHTVVGEIRKIFDQNRVD